MTGSASNRFINSGIWNTLRTNTFAGSSSINNRGTINVFGPTTFSGLTTLTNGGTLNLAAGTAVGTLTMPGNLVFQSSALYVAALNVTASRVADIGGTASLAGAAQGALLPLPLSKQTTILHADGGLGGTTFSGFIAPAGFTGTLTYTPTDVVSTLTANLGAGAGLSTNQQNVASAINNFFNNGGTLPGAFVPVFALSGGSLTNALSHLSGEAATGAERAAIQLTNEFLELMLDPFVNGRGNVGGVSTGATGFAPDQQTNLPPDIALAYASILSKAPPTAGVRAALDRVGFGVWRQQHGERQCRRRIKQHNGKHRRLHGRHGLSLLALHGRRLCAGRCRHQLGAGQRAWHWPQRCVPGRRLWHQLLGPAYVAGALAFSNHWFTTNRSAPGDALTTNFIGQNYGARLESGYRYAVLPAFAVTPYAAVQAQAFHTPAYSESDITSGGFGLSYASMNASDVRTELGARFDDPTLLYGKPLILFGRAAWAHDFVSNPALNAAFQALPGTAFTVIGAPIPQNSALLSAGAQLFVTPNWSVLAKFDGEFGSRSQTYAGSGTLRYTW